MSTHTFTKATLTDKVLAKAVKAALPGKAFTSSRSGWGADNLSFDFTDALTAGEITTLTDTVTGHSSVSRFADTFKVTTKALGRISKHEWFQTDSGGGVYVDLARDEVFAYIQNSLISATSTEYWSDGSIVSQETIEYYTTVDGRNVEKRVINV